MQHCEQGRNTDPGAQKDNGCRARCERERSAWGANLQDISGANMLMQEATREPSLILDSDGICPGGSGPAERIAPSDGWRVEVRSKPDDDVLNRKWRRQG